MRSDALVFDKIDKTKESAPNKSTRELPLQHPFTSRLLLAFAGSSNAERHGQISFSVSPLVLELPDEFEFGLDKTCWRIP